MDLNGIIDFVQPFIKAAATAYGGPVAGMAVDMGIDALQGQSGAAGSSPFNSVFNANFA